MSEEFVLPGESLKAERTRQKLTEKEAADKLHLSCSFIKALEADDYKKLPEAVFVRGYIRNYASLLGLDPEPLVARFDAMREPVRTSKTASMRLPASTMAGKKKVVLAVVLLALLLAVVWVFSQKTTETAGVETASEQVELLQELDADVVGEDEGLTNEEVIEPIDDESLLESELLQTASLMVSFSDRSWVRVADASGQVLFEGVKPPGETLALTGDAPFALRIGDGAAVSGISVNGQAVSLPSFTKGEVGEITVPN